MSSKDKKIDVRGAKAMFEQNQSASSSPATPKKMPGKPKGFTAGSVSSFKDRFEHITAEKAKEQEQAKIPGTKPLSNDTSPAPIRRFERAGSIPKSLGDRVDKYSAQARAKLGDKIGHSEKSRSTTDLHTSSASKSKDKPQNKLSITEKYKKAQEPDVSVSDTKQKLQNKTSERSQSCDPKTSRTNSVHDHFKQESEQKKCVDVKKGSPNHTRSHSVTERFKPRTDDLDSSTVNKSKPGKLKTPKEEPKEEHTAVKDRWKKADADISGRKSTEELNNNNVTTINENLKREKSPVPVRKPSPRGMSPAPWTDRKSEEKSSDLTASKSIGKSISRDKSPASTIKVDKYDKTDAKLTARDKSPTKKDEESSKNKVLAKLTSRDKSPANNKKTDKSPAKKDEESSKNKKIGKLASWDNSPVKKEEGNDSKKVIGKLGNRDKSPAQDSKAESKHSAGKLGNLDSIFKEKNETVGKPASREKCPVKQDKLQVNKHKSARDKTPPTKKNLSNGNDRPISPTTAKTETKHGEGRLSALDRFKQRQDEKKSSKDEHVSPKKDSNLLSVNSLDVQKKTRSPSPVARINKKYEINDKASVQIYLNDLVNSLNEDEKIPLRQLIEYYERMQAQEETMKANIEDLHNKLDKSDVEKLNKTLQDSISETTAKLDKAKQDIEELQHYKQQLHATEERCEDLEELNEHQQEEIEELKLEMAEMRDQFHDDEVHESIILQQRLDDMARSLRIIHFRLKKAEARLQETEREKETLLEEIRILQGGTFTDEEIQRMQSLEGDLQAAKEVSVELHNELERAEERRTRMEGENSRIRNELKSVTLDNERLMNNIDHLKGQLKSSSMPGASDTRSLHPSATPDNLSRQGSSSDVESLKNNLESSIEREQDLKEQLQFSEGEAKTLRRRLRDFEHENEALTKLLKKLSLIQKSGSQGADENIQAEVVHLENTELRQKNETLHREIDDLQTQMKNLNQKLKLVTDEQKQGPLSTNKNSIYYETKFELMSQEIEDLRWQLQERENDVKRMKDSAGVQSRREQFKRANTIEGDKVDPKKQFSLVQQEADILRGTLTQLEMTNEKLLKENRKFQLLASRRKSTDDSTEDLSRKVSTLEKTNQELGAQLQNALSESQQARLMQDMDSENSRLLTELNYYKSTKPEMVEVLNGLQQREEKILAYETTIASMQSDMSKMERNLQDDINSLTMKNSILKSLLEAINEHEEGGAPPNGIQPPGEADFITKHIKKLPSDLQNQFKDKIANLESQLQTERRRAVAAEELIQQVKLHLTTFVMNSSIMSSVLRPKRNSKYPAPPPSLLIKPSAYDSPSRMHLSGKGQADRLQIRHILANQLFAGNTPRMIPSLSSPGSLQYDSEAEKEYDLTVEIQPMHISRNFRAASVPMTVENHQRLMVRGRDNSSNGENNHMKPCLVTREQQQLNNDNATCPTQRRLAREEFYENYTTVHGRSKKKVTFSLPEMQRDVSDMSISSHLSALSDCTVVDDDDDD